MPDAFEKIGIQYEVRGAAQFAKATKDSEIALRRQANALQQNALELRKEIAALRQADSPNRKLIAERIKSLNAINAEKAAITQKISVLKVESAAAKEAAGANKVLQASMAGAGAAAGTLVAALIPLVGLFGAGAIVKAGDDFQNLQARLKNIVGDADQVAKVFDQIVDISNRTGIAIDTVTQAFVRLGPAAQDLGVTNEQLLLFSETFLKMGRLAGATATEINNAMIQLSQGIASGTLRGDELRSVMEQMPQVARTIAKSMGIPFSEFRKAAEEGLITAEQVFNAIIGEAGNVEKAFQDMPVTVERAFNLVSNAAFLFSGRLAEQSGISNGLVGILSKLADVINGLTNDLDDSSSAISVVVRGFQGLADVVGELIGIFGQLFDIVEQNTRLLSGDTLSAVDLVSIAFDSFITILDAVVTSVGFVIDSVQALTNALVALSNFDFQGVGNALGRGIGQAGDRFNGFTERFGQRLADSNATPTNLPTFFRPGGRSGGRPSIVSPGAGASKKGRSRANSAAAAERKLIKAERDQINSIKEALSDALKEVDLEFDRTILKLGAFASEAKKLEALRDKNEKQTNTIASAEAELNALTLKSNEANREKRKVLVDLSQALFSSGNELLDLANKADALDDKIQESVDRSRREGQAIIRNANIDRQQTQLDEERRKFEQLFDDNKISAEQYYDTERDLIERNGRLEVLRLELRQQALREELGQLKDNEEGEARRRDILNEILQIEQDIKGIKQDTDVQTDRITDEEKDRLAETGRRLGDNFESSFSQAIQDALDGQGVGNALKKFGKAMKDAFVREIADGLAKLARRALAPIFDALGQSIAGIFAGQGGSLTGQGLTGATVPGAFTAGGPQGGLLSKIGSLFGFGRANKNNKGPVGGQIGRGVGLLSTAAILGGGILASSGVGGKVGGALGGALAGAGTGALLGSVLPGLGTVVGAVGGAIIGGVAGLFGGGGNKKKEALKQKQLQKTQAFVQNALSAADPNDRNSLLTQLNAVSRFKSGGGEAFAVKRQAAVQLKQLIEEREKAIAEAIKDIRFQNEELAVELADIGALPGATFQQKRDLEFRRLEIETQKLLEQFKDSEEAKTLILEQESLKRQILLKNEQDTAKSTVEDLRDLLIQRDDIANANVFARLRSPEQQKSDTLQKLDKDIASAFLELKAAIDAGVTPLDTEGLNQILGQVQNLGGVNANLEIIIQEANDPNMVREEVTRAFDSFVKKIYGAQVA